MRMNRAGLLLVLLTLAVPLVAADAPKPDYSREAIFRFSHEFLYYPHSEIGDFDLDNLGAINIFKYGLRGVFHYLPLLAPLPGTRLADVATLPNPFALTHTPIARSMPYVPDELSLSPGARREMKRVLQIERQTNTNDNEP